MSKYLIIQSPSTDNYFKIQVSIYVNYVSEGRIHRFARPSGRGSLFVVLFSVLQKLLVEYF